MHNRFLCGNPTPADALSWFPSSGCNRMVQVSNTEFVTELCGLRTFGGVDFSLIFICAQSVSEFLWDRLRASTQFPVMPKRAQYARLVERKKATIPRRLILTTSQMCFGY
eukprot:COSAG02_NODE_536_length_20657_cov_91.744041_9_plen_110_part_00